MAVKKTAPVDTVEVDLNSLRKQLVLARMDLRMGRLKNTNSISKIKKQIARMMTAQQAQKQGVK